jgi:ABC-type uncharacterized transport system substrate-binding protein
MRVWPTRTEISYGSVAWIVTVTLILAAAFAADAQQPKKVPRIGYLTVPPLSANMARVEAFRQGLRELGYVEGKNVVIEWRSADGKVERQGELAAELVRLKVDLIVTSGPTMTRSAKDASATIPIVMAQDSDPVGMGRALQTCPVVLLRTWIKFSKASNPPICQSNSLRSLSL